MAEVAAGVFGIVDTPLADGSAAGASF